MNIGDKVLCIDDKGWTYVNKHPLYMGLLIPKVGEIYTIREVTDSNCGFLLEEIKNRLCPYNIKGKRVYKEPGFLKSRFMPWNPEEEEISIMEERVLVNP